MTSDQQGNEGNTDRRNFMRAAVTAGAAVATVALPMAAAQGAQRQPEVKDPEAPAGLKPMGQPDSRFPIAYETSVPEGMRVVMAFYTAMSRRDLRGIAKTLHFPFVTYEETNLVIVESEEQLMDDPPPSLNVAGKSPGFYGRDSYDIMETVECALFNPIASGFSLHYGRYRPDGHRLLACHGIFGVTNNDGRWAIEYMSSIYKPADQFHATYDAEAVARAVHDVWRDHNLGRKLGDTMLLRKNTMIPGKWASVHTGAPDRTAHREGRPMEPYKVKGVETRIRRTEATREEIHNPSPEVFAKADAENQRFKSISGSGIGGYYRSLEMAGPDGKGVRVLAASTDKGHILGGYTRYAQDGTLIYESRSLDIVCRVNGEWITYEAFKKFGANIHHDHTNDVRT